MVALLGLAPVGAIADEYEYYRGAQFPGKGLREGVELRTVLGEGGKPTEYQRREVKFFPRKGVDEIAVVDGMIKREWTLTEKGKASTPMGFLNGDKLSAHLIGFRGVGAKHNAQSRKQPGPPAVVLRLPDGSKRAYTRGSLSDADIKFLMPIFTKEMARIRDSALKINYEVPSGFRADFPNVAKPGEPGTMLMTTDHVAWGGGSQNPKDGISPFIGKTPEAGETYRSFLREWMENIWTLYEYSGDLMPHWDKPKQYKYVIKVPGTMRDGYQFISGYAGGGYGGCEAKDASVGIIGHEWGHGIRINSLPMGGGEAGADTSSVFCFPGPKGSHHTRSPYRNVFSGFSGYGYTTFWTIAGEDPNHGYGWFNAIPLGHDEGNPLVFIARTLEQRGIAKNGIRGLGDLFGEYAARMSNFDFELQGDYRRGIYAPARQWLEPLDLKENIWRVPMGNAPEPFGMNVVRIVPEKGANKVGIDFMGYHDPKTYSDWRVCLSRVKADGTITYSHLINKGQMEIDIEPDDASIWMTVAATPAAIYHGGAGAKGRMDGMFASGLHAYRYPWKAKFLHCKPGSHGYCKDEYGKDNEFNGKTYAPPQPSSTASAAPAGGQFHENGGGWVADTAQVDASAYVGKNAMVLNQAKVLGHARIEDFAIVKDTAVVKDKAKITGGAVINGGVVFDNYDRTWVNEPILGPAQVNKHKEPTARDLPARGESPELHPESLLANYAMESPNKVLLEDFYRTISDTTYARIQEPNYNGYLTGQPEHFAVGDRLGFRFNGKDQWAELSPQAFDLASATVDMAIWLDGKRTGTIFDFGSSKDDHLVLSVNASGKLQLVATLKGQRVLELSGPAIKPDEWMQVRIEMDGETTSLFVDNKRAASKSTPIRPSDFYLPDAVDANLLAVNRDRSQAMSVAFDYVVIYHTVHEDFSKLSPPRMDTPIMPDAQYLASYKKYVDKINAINMASSQGRPNFDADTATLKPYRNKALGRQKELIDRDPRYHTAEKALAAKRKEIAEMSGKIAAEYDASSEGKQLIEKEQQLGKEYEAARKELQADRSKELERKEVRLRDELNRVRQERRDAQSAAAATKTRKLKMELMPLEKGLDEARNAALEVYSPEAKWLASFEYKSFGKHYNFNYHRYFGEKIKQGGSGIPIHSNVGQLQEIAELGNNPAVWRTQVDWDWRTLEELSGSIDDLPLMKKWIERNRGPIQKSNPAKKK